MKNLFNFGKLMAIGCTLALFLGTDDASAQSHTVNLGAVSWNAAAGGAVDIVVSGNIPDNPPAGSLLDIFVNGVKQTHLVEGDGAYTHTFTFPKPAAGWPASNPVKAEIGAVKATGAFVIAGATIGWTVPGGGGGGGGGGHGGE